MSGDDGSGPLSPPPAAGRVNSAGGRAVAALALASTRRPLVTVVISLLLAAAGTLYTLHALTFVTSNLRLLPQKASYVVRLKDYQRDFGELNDIVVAVEAASPDRSKAYAARLVADLERQGVARSRITYRVDPAYFEGRALLYLSQDDLAKLRDRLFDYQEFIEGYAARPTLPQLLAGLNHQIANSMALGFFDLGLRASGGATDLRFLESVIDQISARLDGQTTYASPWSTAFSVGRLDEPDAGYFFSSDKHWLFLFVQQRREEGNFTDSRGTIEAIRRTIAALRPDFPDVEAGVTGGPAISNDEMSTAFADSEVASILASVLTMALLIGAFRSVVKPVLLMATLTVSLGWSMGIVTLVIGHLSIFSVMFVSIVVGIGVDYGVYWLYRFEEELAGAPTVAAAVRRTGERGGAALLLGALTAMGAFLVLTLTDFQGIREFGFVSGAAILLAFVSMITLFPALLALLPRRWTRVSTPGEPVIARAIWLEGVTGYRKSILAITAALTVLAAWGAVDVGFDYNMLKLQAKGVESVAWEERILTRAGRSGVTALATASSLDELRRKRDAFAALPSVSAVESVLMLVPDGQPEKAKVIAQLAPIVAPVRVAPAPVLAAAELRAPLETLRRRLRLTAEEGSEEAKRAVQPVLAKVEGVLDTLSRADLHRAGPALEQLQGQIAGDFGDKLATFQKNLTPRAVVPGDAPPELRQRYVGSSGRYLLRIQPAVDIWQRAGAERFVTDLRRVDPDVTGPPVTSYEAIRFIQQGYFQGTLYALLLVVLVIAALLRSARATALALVPIALAMLWTLGVMRVLDLQFNLANVWALPLIIGTAAEFGVNVFIRYQEGLDTGGPTLVQSTMLAIFLNGVTTIAGFASLMVAHHRGIFGLGLLLTVGVSAALFAALVVLPVLLRFFYGPSAPDAPAASEPVSPERVTV